LPLTAVLQTFAKLCRNGITQHFKGVSSHTTEATTPTHF
jgi:hypothetical protein